MRKSLSKLKASAEAEDSKDKSTGDAPFGSTPVAPPLTACLLFRRFDSHVCGNSNKCPHSDVKKGCRVEKFLQSMSFFIFMVITFTLMAIVVLSFVIAPFSIVTSTVTSTFFIFIFMFSMSMTIEMSTVSFTMGSWMPSMMALLFFSWWWRWVVSSWWRGWVVSSRWMIFPIFKRLGRWRSLSNDLVSMSWSLMMGTHFVELWHMGNEEYNIHETTYDAQSSHAYKTS